MTRGYLLPCQEQWLDFHLRNSVGGRIVYCGGSGSNVVSRRPGDPVFCIMSGRRPHHFYMWGSFAYHAKMPVAEAFDAFGPAVGAATREGFLDLLRQLSHIDLNGQLGAWVLDDAVAIASPIPIAALDIGTKGSNKGRGLTEVEVTRIFTALAEARLRVPRQPYVPSGNDTRETVSRQIAARRGQNEFRQEAIDRYARCMITGCELTEILEAAHICPYRGDADNHPDNALLLRADLHTLYDLDFIAVNPRNLTIVVHPAAQAAGYAEYDGQVLRCNGTPGPSRAAMKVRWKQFRKLRDAEKSEREQVRPRAGRSL